MGYCIIIVANIINIQLIGTSITCFAFQVPFHKYMDSDSSNRKCCYIRGILATTESYTFHTGFGSQIPAGIVDKLI